MERIELKAVMYTDRPGVLDDDLVDLGAVDFAVLRQDEITPNARGEYLAAEIEPLFEPVMPPEVLPGVVTVEQLEAKLDAIKAALFDAALLLGTVKDDEDAYYSDYLVDFEDADEGVGLLADAWEKLKFGTCDEFVEEALKRGGYLNETPTTQGGTP